MKNNFYLILLLTAVIPAYSIQSDSSARKNHLQWILDKLPPDRFQNGRVSYLDSSFTDWLHRTGELPPDFSKMQSVRTLPDPLILDNQPVTTQAQWERKKAQLRKDLQHYITGTFPSGRDNLKVKIVSEYKNPGVTSRMVELSFGPDNAARLTIELLIPEGKGPFPVFMTQWNHREWAQIAVKRGYIACVYAASDAKDDTEDYSRIWAGKYDFTRLMRRAYGTSAAIDYLYQLPEVNKAQIALTGHSRNGKLSLMAAAFDERITAVATSSGGTGAEVPWRYTTHHYDVEDIALLSTAQPAWLHPRLRFFIGNEDKLPIDQNSFMALIAPRGLLLSTATTEEASNPFGTEQALKSAQSVYNFLNAPDHVGIRYRPGLHGTQAEDIEGYIDFFNYIFKRDTYNPISELLYTYSFNNWEEKATKTTIPSKPGDNQSAGARKSVITQNIRWLLGQPPAMVVNPGPQSLKKSGAGEAYFGNVLKRPRPNNHTGLMHITPYHGFGDYLYANLYYPKEKTEKGEKVPVVIYLHENDYSKGFSDIGLQHEMHSFVNHITEKGYAVLAFDMVGFGNRLEESQRFYKRYQDWSLLGKMVADAQAAVEAMANLDIIDPNNILIAGYSAGATVGLITAALEPRVNGVAAISGIYPLREGTSADHTMNEWSDLNGFLPRLGYFKDRPAGIPVDFEEILEIIAPRQVLLVHPQTDWTTDVSVIKKQAGKALNVYRQHKAEKNFISLYPDDYSRLSTQNRTEILNWLQLLNDLKK